MKSTLLAILFAFAAFAPACLSAPAPLPPDEKAMWAAENQWHNASVRGDVEAVAGFETSGFVLVSPRGLAYGKADQAAMDGNREITYSQLSDHEASIRFYGDTAVITGRIVISGSMRGQPFGGIFAFTETWVRQEGQWKVAATQGVRIARTDRSAVEPLWRDGGGWIKRHEGFVADARKGGVDLLFVGDSITDYWRSRGHEAWDKYFGGLHAANIGISGDRTQHVLWRLEHGEVDGLHPKAVVLMIGTNNTGFERDAVTPRNTTAETAEGVRAVVGCLREKLPDAKILLLAVFPRGHAPDDPQRLQVAEINREIARLDDGSHVHFLDIGRNVLAPDGSLPEDVMPDYLHPNAHGYEIWGRSIQKPLADLMR